ncbi:MAG: LuxR C-terminal-related transcriptional regulator [Lutimonas sp.]
MIYDSHHYDSFFTFTKTYSPQGFLDIHRDDDLIGELEIVMEENDQFLYVADALKLEILFTSKRCKDMIGIPPDDLSLYHFMEATHPEDLQRLNLGRTKLIRMAQDLFIAKKGSSFISTDFRIRNANGSYSNYLIQGLLFYTKIPYETVYFLKIHTRIDWYKKVKKGYHYYIGEDRSYFRYPDKTLLETGNVFTPREFEIIKLIEKGLDSQEIADQLFISRHTVNAHRSNILKKSKKEHISELIYELFERGLL